MNNQPTIQAGVITLAPLTTDDAGRVRLLAGDPAIAETAIRIPHPYPEGAAEEWINDSISGWSEGKSAVWKIIITDSNLLIGAIGLTIDPPYNHAELGYWIGKHYWNCGYAQAAAREIIRFGFETIRINRIYATCLRENPASIRVLEHSGLKYEGCMHEHVFHRGRYHDLLFYGIVHSSSKKE